MRTRLAALLLVGILVAGCSSPPNSGTVYGKDHDRAWYEHQLACAAYDKDFNCIIWVPYRIYHEERWLLCLVDDNDDGHRGCLEVPREHWEQYAVGTHYPDPR